MSNKNKDSWNKVILASAGYMYMLLVELFTSCSLFFHNIDHFYFLFVLAQIYHSKEIVFLDILFFSSSSFAQSQINIQTTENWSYKGIMFLDIIVFKFKFWTNSN